MIAALYWRRVLLERFSDDSKGQGMAQTIARRRAPRKDPLPQETILIGQIGVTCKSAWKITLTRDDLEEWLSNFNGEVFSKKYERQLALWLLLNFVYYNKAEVGSLCRSLYRGFLHHEIATSPAAASAEIRAKVSELMARTRFYQLGRAGESSGFILYLFRNENRLSLENFIGSIDRVPNEVDTIIYVDDVCLSGTQADKYLKRDAKKLTGKRRLLLALFAPNEAKELLARKSVDVVSVYTLDERSECFSSKSDMFTDFVAHRENAKDLAAHYGKRAWEDWPLGFNNGGYAFGLFYNTPDNALPIFWGEQNGWKPVIKRYHKKYHGEGHNELGAFV